MSDLTLVLGNKAYSSWSMRPWLMLKHTGAAFREVVIPLRQPDTKAAILEHSPAGRVPVLHDGSITIWDSLAIGEYLAERFPAAGLWPAAPEARALARSISAEMHSGFTDLRANMPMNLKQKSPGAGRTPAVDGDIARITALWNDARTRFGQDGPFLFGGFTIADAMYAPVVTRFDTYGVDLDPISRAYADAVLALPAVREWYADAAREPWEIRV
jgi:glutathione S-transferase